MDAVILAAGRGTRLLPLTANVPKCLLEIRPGTPVIGQQLTAIEQAGQIERVLIVVGYKAEAVEARLAQWLPGVAVEFVFNPFFEECNAIVSLWLALQRRPKEFVVLNGDVIFNSTCLRGLLEAPRSREVCLLFSEKAHLQDDAVKINQRQGSLTRIGKDIDAGSADGESAGMVRFLGDGAREAIATADQMMRDRANRSRFWYALLTELLERKTPIATQRCDPGDWFEIDYHADLEMATRYLDTARERVAHWDTG